jgi:hypothetical protein
MTGEFKIEILTAPPTFMIVGPVLSEILRRNAYRANMERVGRMLGMSTGRKRLPTKATHCAVLGQETIESNLPVR